MWCVLLYLRLASSDLFIAAEFIHNFLQFFSFFVWVLDHKVILVIYRDVKALLAFLDELKIFNVGENYVCSFFTSSTCSASSMH